MWDSTYLEITPDDDTVHTIPALFNLFNLDLVIDPVEVTVGLSFYQDQVDHQKGEDLHIQHLQHEFETWSQ